MIEQPSLTFFCELEGLELRELFADASIIKKLRQLNANISMGIRDFSDERLEVVRKLTRAGIPVTAWLLLPKDQGYWTSLDTVGATAKVYASFKAWSQKNRLNWGAVGLDIEPYYERMLLLQSDWKKMLPDLFSRLFLKRKYALLENDLRSLINLIRSDGYAVETYNFPFVVDECLSDSRILTRLLGTPPLNADREVLMLYSSFFEKDGDAILLSYARQANGIGLGSTGGGVEVDGQNELRSLRWIDLRRDLLIAKQFSRNLYIFSLEGSVRNGYLDRLLTFDWQAAVDLPIAKSRKITLLRKVAQSFLWALSHPLESLLALIVVNRLLRKK